MSHILTSVGRYFEFDKPDGHLYQVTEIAHALSHICRFTGHCRKFYSVAQHAVLVSYLVPAEDALEGLHHDDSEAYLGDVSSPLKRKLDAYISIEASVEASICYQLGLRYPFPPSVKNADMRLLMNEKKDNMPRPLVGEPDVKWPDFQPYPGLRIRPMPSWMAKLAFLDRHAQLTKGGTWFQKFRLKLGLSPLTLIKMSLPG